MTTTIQPWKHVLDYGIFTYLLENQHCIKSIDDFGESILSLSRTDSKIAPFFHLAVDKRPEEELYDIRVDPYCLNNLAGKSEHEATTKKLRLELRAYLTQTKDPRMSPDGEKIYESYIRYSPIRKYPEPGN
ncbi:hypothetical protein EZE20_17250 [Arundinibacter roseus]|uniref:N-sulphoglucosamine sulphohydrolase C-terminal domain-containing protein n=1 Tax=Arundinibacter roseus TaxID=2070510 RepID=A0A4R4K5H6_9BACT|nr:hypothetical protein EZE20_17250 [Arundinibacter roseus]